MGICGSRRGAFRQKRLSLNGHQYTYFGIFPSLLRIPIFALTSSLDGRLTAPSILASWITTALFCSLLLWRLRIILRGKMALGWTEAISYGVLLASILAGSVLMFLAAGDDVYAEDLAWSVALACASLFAILGVVEHPTKGRVRHVRRLRSPHRPEPKHHWLRRHLCNDLDLDLVRHGTGRI